MFLVIKIGGSLLFKTGGQLHLERFKEYAEVIRQLIDKDHKLVIVVGGGVFANTLVNECAKLVTDRESLDRLGIAATWINAQVMITALGEIAHHYPIMKLEDLLKWWEQEKLLVVGGLQPGQSTNAVAACIAELRTGTIIVNVTNVDGVYDREPKRFSSAKLLPEVTVSELRKIIDPLSSKPGTYPLFDKRALDIVERANIEVWFVNGKNPKNILRAVENKEVGTRLVTK
jgi:uridylate kinase